MVLHLHATFKFHLKTVSASCFFVAGMILGWGLQAAESAPAFYCRVTQIDGNAFLVRKGEKPALLRTGDLIEIGDEITVGPASRVDLIYDVEGKNLVRLGQNTKVITQAGSPASLYTDGGEVFLKLRSLPKNSVFEIRTPVAVVTANGTAYRVEHRHTITKIYVYSGKVNIAALDDKGNRMAGPILLRLNQEIEIEREGKIHGPRSLSRFRSTTPAPLGSVSTQGPPSLKIRKAESAYYIEPSCDTAEDSVAPCSEEQKEATDEDHLMYAGDVMTIPSYEDRKLGPEEATISLFRASLNRPHSILTMAAPGTNYIFKGTMVLCTDYDPQTKKLHFKLFQTLATTYEVAYTKEGGTTISISSLNPTGLKNTTVAVTKGAVAVTVPWPCKKCTETRTFLVHANECYTFYPAPTPPEEIFAPIVDVVPPPTDIAGDAVQ